MKRHASSVFGSWTFLGGVTLSVALGAAAPRPAAGHALWVTPMPRDQQDGYKDPPRAPPGNGAPCGISRMVPPQPQTAFTAGQPLHVEWRETVDHPGCFVVDFAPANDASFQILGVKSHSGAAGATPRAWSLDVTLPNVNCPTCTLRLRQLMLNGNVSDAQCPPATIPAGSTYYSCANITLSGGSGSADAGTGSGSGGSTGTTGAGGSTTTTGAGGNTGTTTGAGGATSSTGDGGTTGSGQGGSTTGSGDSGGGCALAGGQATGGALVLVLAALALRRRRR